MNRIFDRALHLIYPCRCAFCNRIIESNKQVCDDCGNKTAHLSPIKTVLKNSFCISAFPYNDIYRRAVLDFKFKKRKRNADCFSGYIAKAVRECYKNERIDCITAVPLTRKQKKKRGFNQAEELGRSLAENLGVPYRECLVKIRDNQYQHTLSKSERAKNVKGVYKTANQEINNLKILIVDDIVTTGFTLEECCKVLEKSECKVICCTLCKTI